MQRSRRVLASVAATVASAAALAACGPMGPYRGEARDTWSRTYTISKAGEVAITNVNGRVDVEGVDGSTVEVQAERIARGATDQLAAELLPKIPINDKSTPDLVQVETGRISGILIGASFEVRYRVKAPKGATVRASTVNGGVEVRALSGRVSARTTNGGIVANDITGGLEAQTVNGGVRANFSSIGTRDVRLGTVNGGVRVSLPESSKATFNATWVNGGFDTGDLKFEIRESGKRHFEGLLNGGGTQINVNTVNGGIRLGSARLGDTDQDDDGPKKELKALKGHDGP
jgi:Putative adhesin